MQFVLNISALVKDVLLVGVRLADDDPATFVGVFLDRLSVHQIELIFQNGIHQYFRIILFNCQLVLKNYRIRVFSSLTGQSPSYF